MPNLLKILGVVAIAYYLSNKTTQTIFDGFSVKGVKFVKSELTTEGIEISVDLKVQNDNRAGAKAQSFQGSLFALGANVATVAFRNSIDIPGPGTVDLPLIANVNFLTATIGLAESFTTGKWLSGSRVKGTLTLDNGIQIPVDLPILTIG